MPRGIALNLGCGDDVMPGLINVDIMKGDGVDEIYDLTQHPWKWESESINKIYCRHFLEHIRGQKGFFEECYRILCKGGILEITVPHSSSAAGVGCLGHYRTYSFNTLNDYLSRPFYMFGKPLFKTIIQRIIWQPGYEWTPIQWLIDLSPRAFERIWCYWVGGAWEVRWIGQKI